MEILLDDEIVIVDYCEEENIIEKIIKIHNLDFSSGIYRLETLDNLNFKTVLTDLGKSVMDIINGNWDIAERKKPEEDYMERADFLVNFLKIKNPHDILKSFNSKEYIHDYGEFYQYDDDVNDGHMIPSSIIYLKDAIESGHKDLINLIIDMEGVFEEGDYSSVCHIQYNEILIKLLEKGANVDHPGGWMHGTALGVAVRSNDIEKAKILIKYGASLDIKAEGCGGGNSDIIPHCIDMGYTEMFKVIINACSDENMLGKAIIQSSESNYLMLEYLITSGIKYRINEALHNADCPEKIEILINNGADVNSRDSEGNTIMMKNIYQEKILDLGADPLMMNNDGETTLFNACKNGNIEMVDRLVNLGVDIKAKNKYGETAISFCRLWGYYKGDSEKVILKLIEHGLDINELDRNGDPIICKIPRFGDCPKTVNFLVSVGADINSTDSNGNTAIINAVNSYHDKDRIVTDLINNGININIQNNNGITALMSSYIHNNGRYFKLLLKNGADINIKDNNGMTLLSRYKHFRCQLSYTDNYKNTIKKLVDNGAK